MVGGMSASHVPPCGTATPSGGGLGEADGAGLSGVEWLADGDGGTTSLESRPPTKDVTARAAAISAAAAISIHARGRRLITPRSARRPATPIAHSARLAAPPRPTPPSPHTPAPRSRGPPP